MNVEENPYLKKLSAFGALLQGNRPAPIVAATLGNQVSALESVPAALYSFIRCLKPNSDFPQSNPMVRTIAYAISLGGDTDTIASMAGAICGAYFGDACFTSELMKRMEGAQFYLNAADTINYRFTAVL
ncbi:hypothetical protein D918_06970 [Trichuris suis]|nr:hypothetical protein D918_06970 [Trichuris suis]